MKKYSKRISNHKVREIARKDIIDYYNSKYIKRNLCVQFLNVSPKTFKQMLPIQKIIPLNI